MNDLCDRLMTPTARPILSDSDMNVLAGLAHEACEWHCDACGCCSYEMTGPGATRDLESVIDEVEDAIYCLDCSPDYVQSTHGMPMMSVVSGDMVRRQHWDTDCALMATQTGDGWFLAMHYRQRPGSSDWVPVHASRRVWPQDGDWIAA